MTPRAEWHPTAGGTFDPTDRGVHFAAGNVMHAPTHYLLAVNDVSTASEERELDKHLNEGRKVFLDSGVFNLTNAHKRATGCTMDEALALPPHKIKGWDQLWSRYVYLVNKYGDRLWGYTELDQGGEKNKRITRNKLHDLGLNPIPVYHPLVDTWDYFDELAERYDRICFGNVVQADLPTRVRLLHTMWERHRHYPELWIHVLGLTANDWCLPCAPDSTDSSTWISGLRYPTVSLGSSGMRRQGSITARSFRYDPQWDGAPDDTKMHHRWRTLRMYSDEVWSTLANWQQMRQDQAKHFGITEPHQAPDPTEKVV